MLGGGLIGGIGAATGGMGAGAGGGGAAVGSGGEGVGAGGASVGAGSSGVGAATASVGTVGRADSLGCGGIGVEGRGSEFVDGHGVDVADTAIGSTVRIAVASGSIPVVAGLTVGIGSIITGGSDIDGRITTTELGDITGAMGVADSTAATDSVGSSVNGAAATGSAVRCSVGSGLGGSESDVSPGIHQPSREIEVAALAT